MFDRIAQDWSNKRQHPWPPLISILTPYLTEYFQKNQYFDQKINQKSYIFADLGSGSGRHSEYLLKYCRILIDLDQSREMLKRNQSNSMKIQADICALPFRSDSLDGIFAIASIHHIKGSITRENVMIEFQRISTINALIVITVWRFKQKRFIKEYLHQITKMTYDTCKEKPYSNKNIDFEVGDVIVPWKLSSTQGNLSINRFYHLFRAVEFRKLIKYFTPILIQAFGAKKEKNNFLFIGNNPQKKKDG
ncbi:class I SAM-dependent methyltransferase [Candidatus Harpocratesius sp.]